MNTDTPRPIIRVTPVLKYHVTGNRLHRRDRVLTAPLTPAVAELFTSALNAGGDRMILPTLVGLINSGRYRGLLTPEGTALLWGEGWEDMIEPQYRD